MKKCPEKIDLLKYLDGELEASARAAFERHLNECPNCRNELALFKAAEKHIKDDFNTAFRDVSVKKAVMKEIKKPVRTAAPTGKAPQKTSWFWILAPGIAIILFAALFTLVRKPACRTIIYTCQAMASSSRINGHKAELGKVYDLGGIFSPMRIDGDFIFTVIASATSKFQHSGVSVISPVENDVLKIQSASSTWLLLEGEPVGIVINDKKRTINKRLLEVVEQNLGSADRAIDINASATVQQPQKIETVTFSEYIATDTSNLNVEETLTETETEKTAPVSPENEDDSASASHNTAPVNRNLNPFLDKPLELNGN
ncbi:MAG: hypothetical protein PWR01_3526 [Clostridiales bacterium]|nr:hypothetical protein [Clostridiales bacterium]MDN5282453.1 hypothetical protein [Candidatus Ozemobacter sp.]